MAFDPSKPADATLATAGEMRSQLTALKALIDAQPVLAYGRVASDWTSSSSSFSDVTGLSFAVGAGENWTAEIILHAISSSAGQGFKFRVSGPGAGSVMIAIFGTATSTSTSIDCEVQTAFSVASPARHSAPARTCPASSASTSWSSTRPRAADHASRAATRDDVSSPGSSRKLLSQSRA
jgi:hypothetical protein